MVARHPTMVEVATRSLRNEILTGELAPGARIHLNEAANRLSMSPVPVREALRELSAEGLVLALSQRGYRVRDISESDLLDTYRLRCVLDAMATELAVPRLQASDIERAALALEALARAYREEDWVAHGIHHREFHWALYEPCDSPWLLHTMGMLWENSVRYQRLSAHRRGSIADRTREHQQILDTCAAGDAAGAASLVKQHLNRTCQTVRTILQDVNDAERDV